MKDKVVNHLVAKYILYPALLPCLIPANVASRKNLGTKKGLHLAKDFHRICRIKYHTYYILKCDIRKFFASIDHNILKEKLTLNTKTRIYKNTDNFIFLGRTKNNKYAKHRTIKRKLKKQQYLYHSGKVSLKSLISSMICYENLDYKLHGK